MSWRIVVISQRAKLDLKMNYLVVRKQDETVKIFLGEIGQIIIESTAVSLTASLLCELVKRKIKVIFCDEKRNPCSELLPYYGSHDTSEKIRTQMEWGEYGKGSVWTKIIREKIKNQRDLLRQFQKKESELLDNYLEELTYRDKTNREGHAAKVYFNALFGTKFTRSAETPVNAALNYGYAIFLSSVNREIVSNGYITQIGIFHDNMFNDFNLGSDLVEPLRMIVDEYVYTHQPEEFGHNEKMALLDLLNQEVWIDGRRQVLNNAIKIYCKSVGSDRQVNVHQAFCGAFDFAES